MRSVYTYFIFMHHTHTLMNTRNTRRGFTLVELLVVITIIGILSSVVLASLNTARSKGSDAAIQSDLNAIRTQAELYYLTTGNSTYGTTVSDGSCASGMFSADTSIAKAIAAADNVNGSSGTMKCESNGSAYLVAAELVGTSGSYWCIDSNGTAKVHAGAVSTISNTAYACPS